MNLNLNQLFIQQQTSGGLQQQQQQRINYCTICNKELCNKYFMKTHMLKMHGINLEMDTTTSSSSSEAAEASIKCRSQPEQQQHQKEDQPEDCSNWREQQPLPADLSLKTHGGGGGQKGKPQPTSVANGFAGNSMGGVICDICNKELCSKYFLKVHKQNTHGIATDTNYLPSCDPTANPFTVAAALSMYAGSPFAAAGMPHALAAPFKQQPQISHQTITSEQNHKPQRPKKIKLDTEQRHDEHRTGAESSAGQQLESLYRLMIAQQQHQHTATSAAAAEDPLASAVAAATAAAAAAAAAMNPLAGAALMCFGQGAGPAAFMQPASLSPAMIVDQILRHQHLFNKPQPRPQKDNNNNEAKKQPTSSSSSSSSGSNNNKRYFSHYTEACPMCDRRFKSIKWLKTHMMNDHKHEIGAYMQSMMQYFYQQSGGPSLKSHQPACNQTFDQQQQQQTFQQQQQQYSSFQANQLMSLFSQQQQQQQQYASLQLPQFVDHTAQQQQQQYQRAIFEAAARQSDRRSTASLSPSSSPLNAQIKREPSPRNSPLSSSSATNNRNRAPGTSFDAEDDLLSSRSSSACSSPGPTLQLDARPPQISPSPARGSPPETASRN